MSRKVAGLLKKKVLSAGNMSTDFLIEEKAADPLSCDDPSLGRTHRNEANHRREEEERGRGRLQEDQKRS